MHSHPTPSAHVCTPRPERRNKPRNPAKPRPAKLLFPELPKGKGSANPEFWRAAFLRDLYMLGVGRRLLAKACALPWTPINAERDATTLFLSASCSLQYSAVRESFTEWMNAVGGLAGPGCAEGGAA